MLYFGLFKNLLKTDIASKTDTASIYTWCEFWKTKLLFKNYWVGMLKNRQDLLDCGTVK